MRSHQLDINSSTADTDAVKISSQLRSEVIQGTVLQQHGDALEEGYVNMIEPPTSSQEPTNCQSSTSLSAIFPRTKQEKPESCNGNSNVITAPKSLKSEKFCHWCLPSTVCIFLCGPCLCLSFIAVVVSHMMCTVCTKLCCWCDCNDFLIDTNVTDEENATFIQEIDISPPQTIQRIDT